MNRNHFVAKNSPSVADTKIKVDDTAINKKGEVFLILGFVKEKISIGKVNSYGDVESKSLISFETFKNRFS